MLDQKHDDRSLSTVPRIPGSGLVNDALVGFFQSLMDHLRRIVQKLLLTETGPM